MRLTISDISIGYLENGELCDGSKFFNGRHSQVKQAVKDSLTGCSNWDNAIDTIDERVSQITGKQIIFSTYDLTEIYNSSRMDPSYTLNLEVKGILDIVMTVYK